MTGPPITSSLERLKDRVARNEFEKMTISGLEGDHVVSFDRYFLSAPGKQIFDTRRAEFLEQWANVFKGGEQPRMVESALNSDFELDCCVKFTTDSTSTHLADIFRAVVSGKSENIFALNDEAQPHWDSISIGANDCIAFEFTEKASFIPRMLYQIERMLQLRESCIPGLDLPKAVGIVVNGKHSEFVEAVRRIDKSRWVGDLEVPRVFSLPLFVLFSPYRNIYTEIADFRTEVADFRDSTKKSIADLQNAFRWSLMTRSELRAVSASMGVQVSSWVSKRKIILKLMDHAESAATVHTAGSGEDPAPQFLVRAAALLPALERGRQTPPVEMFPTYPEHPDRCLHPAAALLPLYD